MLCAFPLINLIGEHLTLMRWLVIVVIIYAALSMLHAGQASITELPDPEIESIPDEVRPSRAGPCVRRSQARTETNGCQRHLPRR
jgi:hypothetical protein